MKKRKQYTNIAIKLHHLERRKNRKVQKPDKYCTQQHLQQQFADEQLEQLSDDNIAYLRW